MNNSKLTVTEVIESNRVLDFSNGRVAIYEREVHDFYRPERASRTRLVISGAIDSTRTFIAITRDEFSELNSLLRELVPR